MILKNRSALKVFWGSKDRHISELAALRFLTGIEPQVLLDAQDLCQLCLKVEVACLSHHLFQTLKKESDKTRTSSICVITGPSPISLFAFTRFIGPTSKPF